MRKWLMWSTLLLLALTLSGCYVGELPSCQPYLQSDGNGGLPYETIEWQSLGERLWPDAEPGLRIVAVPEDIPAVAPYVSDTAEQALHQLDFTSYFAVIVFAGLDSGGTSIFCVTQVARRGMSVIVSSQLIYPGFGPPVEVSPYHLIAVQKAGTWETTFTFQLQRTLYTRTYDQQVYFPIQEDQGIVASISHIVP